MKLFSTKRQLPFLEMLQTSYGMQLQVNEKPISSPIDFDGLFTDVDVSHLTGPEEFLRLIIANALCNTIAQETKRGTGNILFVPDHDTKTWFEHSGFPLSYKCVINRSLTPTELRATYWKATNVVDGGIQYSPEGFSCLPNYKSYFMRCIL